MSSDSENQRKLRNKILKPDFTARCGHTFHTSELKKKDYEYYTSECHSCKIKIYISKMIEGVLFKAREHDKSNFKELVNFFEQFENTFYNDFEEFHCWSDIIEVDIKLIKIAIDYGYDLNKADIFNKRLLQYIAQSDNVYKLNCLIWTEFGNQRRFRSFHVWMGFE